MFILRSTQMVFNLVTDYELNTVTSSINVYIKILQYLAENWLTIEINTYSKLNLTMKLTKSFPVQIYKFNLIFL